MHDDLEKVFYLLSIAKFAQDWPNLHPLRDRAMEALEALAKSPAHTTSARSEPAPAARPFQAAPRRPTSEDK